MDTERQHFRGAQPGVEHQLQHAAVALARRIARLGSAEEQSDLLTGQDHRETAWSWHVVVLSSEQRLAAAEWRFLHKALLMHNDLQRSTAACSSTRGKRH